MKDVNYLVKNIITSKKGNRNYKDLYIDTYGINPTDEQLYKFIGEMLNYLIKDDEQILNNIISRYIQ